MNTFFFFLLVSAIGLPTARAASVQDFERERNAARQRAMNEIAINDQIRNRIADKKQRKIRALNQRRTALNDYQRKLERGANAKISQVDRNLKELTQLREYLGKVNQEYQASLQIQKEAYTELNQRFRDYQETEVDKRDYLHRKIRQIQQAQSVAELAPARRELQDLYHEEREKSYQFGLSIPRLTRQLKQIDEKYQEQIAPVRAQMIGFGISRIPTIDVTLRNTFDRLEKMTAYSNQREHYFSSTIEQKFPEIEKQIKNMVSAKVKEDVNDYNQLKVFGSLSQAWHQSVEQFFTRKDEISQNPKNRVTVGCQEKLRQHYDLYLEILSNRDKCANLNAGTGIKSPYDTGCLLFRPLISEAEDFFAKAAWRKMNLSLFSGRRDAPKHLDSLMKRLRSLKDRRADGLEKPELLLKAVKIHDQLLEEWSQWNADPSREII